MEVVEVACDATVAWRLLADPALAPAWVAGVSDAAVLARDADGRALRVRFVGMPSVGSLEYEVVYAHDDAAMTLRWETAPGAERPFSGAARIVAIGDGRCRLEYGLTAEPGRGLPRWAQASLADDTPERTARAFQRFAERRARDGAPG